MRLSGGGAHPPTSSVLLLLFENCGGRWAAGICAGLIGGKLMKSMSQGRDTRTSRSVNMLDFSPILLFFLRNGGTNTCKSAWRSSSSHSVDTRRRRSERTNSANHLFYLFLSIDLDPHYGFKRESRAFSLSVVLLLGLFPPMLRRTGELFPSKAGCTCKTAFLIIGIVLKQAFPSVLVF